MAVIGSLQIAVPAGCMNDCSFCIYKQHLTKFNAIWKNDFERWAGEIEKRIRYATDQVRVVIITSQGEPTLNMPYIRDTLTILSKVATSLAQIEIQTSGVGLTEDMLDQLYQIEVRVVSLSIPALRKEKILEVMKVTESYSYDPISLVRLIRSKGFILGLSIAMTNWFDDYSLDDILTLFLTEWIPNQVSFKRLYGADDIASKRYDDVLATFTSRRDFKKLELLPFGVWKYDVRGIG
ncbi:radical SAM protein, partial [Candidatus Thorarchaeota archaeon]